MKKRISIFLLLVIISTTIIGCGKNDDGFDYSKYKKFDGNFMDTFDTITQVVMYTESEEEFDMYMEKIKDRFMELHQKYDKYNNYDGINNIKTINDNAGIKPVKVDKDIMDMILFSLEWYEKAGEETNIALGPVVDIWKKHRDKAEDNPENAEMPSMDELKEAAKYTDINKIIVDEEESTIYLEDENMSLDVGSVAKGYATELVALDMEEEGLKSAIISAGGNIRIIGKPLDGERDRWGIGIQNPDKDLIDSGNVLDTVYVNQTSVVSSGDYQRYYYVGDKRLHHIIDPHTLMPGDHYRAVTIVTPHSGLADFLSTSVFLLPFDKSLELVESLDDVEALWVMPDGEVKASEGMKDIMYSEGASGAD